MKKRGLIGTLALAMAFNAVAVPASAQQTRIDNMRPADRYAELAMDEATGKVLYERNAQHAVYPASTTKLMTAYLVFKALKEGKLQLDDMLDVSHAAAYQPSTNLWMAPEVMVKTYTTSKNGHKIAHYHKERPKQTVFKIKAETALRGMLCHSANDAAWIFAEAIGGSEPEFVKMMNEQAQKLGMTNTHFANPNGLPDRTNKTTLEDMAKLARALIEDFPEDYKYFSIPSITYNGHFAKNTNHLLGVYPGMDGMKTGWIEMSGFNLIASAKQNGTRVIGLVFGATLPDIRNEDMRHLLDFAFTKAKNPKARFAYGPNPPVGQAARYVDVPKQNPPVALVPPATEPKADTPAVTPPQPSKSTAKSALKPA